MDTEPKTTFNSVWDAIEATQEQAESMKIQSQLMIRIEELEAKLQSMALDCLAADGQAADAYQAQLAAEAKLAKAMEIIKAYGEDEGYIPRRVSDIYDELKGHSK